MPKKTILSKHVQEAIKQGNAKIADFKQHTIGKLYLTTALPDLNHFDYSEYIISVEAVRFNKLGIPDEMIAELPSKDFTLREYLEVLISLQREWGFPIMCHDFPKKLFYMMQKKYGKDVIRTDLYYYPY